MLRDAAAGAALVARAGPESAVTMVPALTGLGALHWDAEARGAVFGLTRGTGPAELVRAALESVCFQTIDPVAAMRADGAAPEGLRIDGGMARNRWFGQRLAALLARLGAGLADGLAAPRRPEPGEALRAPARRSRLRSCPRPLVRRGGADALGRRRREHAHGRAASLGLIRPLPER